MVIALNQQGRIPQPGKALLWQPLAKLVEYFIIEGCLASVSP
jgi:hypothetical protein